MGQAAFARLIVSGSLRQPNGPDLAFFNQLCHLTHRFLDRRRWVHAVEIVQIDPVRTQSTKTLFAGAADIGGRAIHP